MRKAFTLLFVAISSIAYSQHLPSLSELGLTPISKVMFHDNLDRKGNNYYYLCLKHQNGYVVSGDCSWAKDGDSDHTCSITISSNPVEMVYTEKDLENSVERYWIETLKDFNFNNDGTVKQFTVCQSTKYSTSVEEISFEVSLQYDDEQHLVRLEYQYGPQSRIIENEWKDGNLISQIKTTKRTNKTTIIKHVFSYGNEINPGVDIFHELGTIPIEVMGVFGRTSKILPDKVTVWDNGNDPYDYVYSYFYDDQHRLISTKEGYYPYGYETFIEELIQPQGEIKEYDIDGKPRSNSKGLKVVKKSAGESQIVFIK